MTRDEEKQVQIEKIQTLLAYFEQQTNPETHEHAAELLRALMDLHSDCLSHIVSAITDRGEPGREILNTLAEDESVSGLLILYGLHPLSLQQRITRAIDELGRTLKSHNASLELVAVDEGVVRLRLTANGSGCHSSPATLKELINDMLLGVAPDLAEVVIEEVTPEPKLVFVPLQGLTKTRPLAKAGA